MVFSKQLTVIKICVKNFNEVKIYIRENNEIVRCTIVTNNHYKQTIIIIETYIVSTKKKKNVHRIAYIQLV